MITMIFLLFLVNIPLAFVVGNCRFLRDLFQTHSKCIAEHLPQLHPKFIRDFMVLSCSLFFFFFSFLDLKRVGSCSQRFKKNGSVGRNGGRTKWNPPAVSTRKCLWRRSWTLSWLWSPKPRRTATAAPAIR